VNQRVRVAEGLDGQIVVLACWCRTCRAETGPDRDGVCPWCGSRVLDEARLSASKMLEQLRAGGLGPLPADEVESPAVHRRASKWTQEELVAAIRRWADLHGSQPTSTRWMKSAGPGWPATNTCVRAFGSWAAAVRAAGFEPLPNRIVKASGGSDGLVPGAAAVGLTSCAAADKLADGEPSGAPAGLREQAVEGDSLPVVPLAADEAAA